MPLVAGVLLNASLSALSCLATLQVMETPELAQGFDDPEIMKAVEEIGKNPELIKTRYANNAKVARFYKAMAGHVGQQLIEKGGAGKKLS